MAKIKLHLLVDEDYIDSFVTLLPFEKVRIVEANFEENQEKLQKILENYIANSNDFKEYYKSMEEMSIWLNERENR